MAKFTTTTTGPDNLKPVAVLATYKIDAVIGSIIQLDGRKSYDPEKQSITWKWRFAQVPIGSTVKDSGFRNIRPRGTAVSFIPDKTGVYVAELVVNDGELDSDPVTVAINIQITRVPLGENLIPDAHFLWNYISNFWNLVEDREIITTIWSSVIQTIGSDLITLWGTDYNKSLSTIQNSFQRRWQPIGTSTDLLSATDQRIIAGKTDSGTAGATGKIGEEPGVENTQVFYMPRGKYRSGTETDFTKLAGNYGAKGRIISINGEGYTIQRVSNENSVVEEASDMATVVGGGHVQSAHSAFQTNKVQTGQWLVLKGGAYDGSYLIDTVVSETELIVTHLNGSPITFATAEVSIVFQVVKPYTVVVVDENVIPDGQVGVSWRIPHLLHTPSLDLEAAGVRKGDVLIFEVTRGDLGLSAELRTQVVCVDRHRLGFEFSLGELGYEPTYEWSYDDDTERESATGFSDTDIGKVAKQLDDGSYWRLTSVLPTWARLKDKVVEVMDRDLIKALIQNLKLVPPDAADRDIAGVAEAFIAFMPVAINLATRPFTTYKLTLKAKRVIHNTVVPVDPAIISIPVLQEQVKDPPVILRENLDYIIESGGITFINGLFTPEDPAPDKLWAECAIFDNSGVIEQNFGRLVGLLANDLTAKQTRAPYLSAVRGLFFAYTNGPTVANMRLGLQILLGLPFTEERGIVLEAQDNFTKDSAGNPLGRILIEDIDEKNHRTGLRRLYFYPTVVGLETNPITRVPYKIGDTIERFVPLSKGIEVEDYVKDPLWWKRAFMGLEILKYFTFKILIDGEVFDSHDVTFAFEFVKAIKPAYTKAITTALLSYHDEIEVEDAVGGSLALRFYDNTWGLEACNKASDDNQQGVVLWNAGSPPLETRTPKLLHDVRTYGYPEDGPFTAVQVSSVTGWGSELTEGRNQDPLIRARSIGEAPIVEGDLLVILPGQSGSGSQAPGLYEIGTVLSNHKLELLQAAPFTAPDTLEIQELDPDLFEYGEDLQCVIIRRSSNPVIKGDDLVTTDIDGVVTSASANFKTNAVSPGDTLVIEAGPLGTTDPNPNMGEYIIDATTGEGVIPPEIVENQVLLKTQTGDPAVFMNGQYQLFRVIRRKSLPRIVYGAKTYSDTPGMVLEVRGADSGILRDVFTPGMVGTFVEVSDSDETANDGIQFITEYLDCGRVVLGYSTSFDSDTTAKAIIAFARVFSAGIDITPEEVVEIGLLGAVSVNNFVKYFSGTQLQLDPLYSGDAYLLSELGFKQGDKVYLIALDPGDPGANAGKILTLENPDTWELMEADALVPDGGKAYKFFVARRST